MNRDTREAILYSVRELVKEHPDHIEHVIKAAVQGIQDHVELLEYKASCALTAMNDALFLGNQKRLSSKLKETLNNRLVNFIETIPNKDMLEKEYVEKHKDKWK